MTIFRSQKSRVKRTQKSGSYLIKLVAQIYSPIASLCAFLMVFILGFAQVSAQADTLTAQRTLFTSTNKNADYVFTLGAVKTVNATTVAKREIRLTGEVGRTTYEFDLGLNIREAWELVEQHVNFDNAVEYFSCSGLDCGSSNIWANDRFGIKQLYGLDQTQRYHAFRLSADANRFVALYFVQRGNRRIYVQIDTIDVEGASVPKIAASPSVILDRLARQGWYAVDFTHADKAESEKLRLLVEALQLKPFLSFYIIGHDYSSKIHARNLEQGLVKAQELGEALREAGIAQSRFDVLSAADMAPRALPAQSRIEIVLKP